MMDRFPSMLRNVNDGLDELLQALDKVNSICSQAEQMSPVLKQLARMVNERQGYAGQAKQVQVSHVPRGKRYKAAGSKRRRTR